MDFKPNEFFLGLVDFIAILLPGCLLAGIFLMAEAQTPILKEPLYCIGLKDGVTVFFGIGYLFTGYTLGYFLSSTASCLDIVYDSIRDLIYPDKEAEIYSFSAHLLHLFFELEWKIKPNKALQQVEAIKPGKYLEGAVNHFQWSSIILDTYFPAAGEKASRSMAASKFFRSLVIVFLLAFALQWGQWLPKTISSSLWVGLTILSFREYVVQRQKSVQAAYRGMITFYHLPAEFKKELK